MSRIGDSSGGTPGQPGMAGDHRFQTSRQNAAPNDARGLLGRERTGRAGASDQVGSRSAAFSRSMRAAAEGDGDVVSADSAQAVERVLAVAQWQGGSTMLMPQDPPVSESRVSLSSELEAVVTDLTVRIEQAMKAEMFATGSGAQEVTGVELELGDALPGIAALSIALSRETLDVTLTRQQGEPSEELICAAQALAERLQTRFGKRTVRVLDRTGDGESAPETTDSLAAIARILGGSRSSS